MTLQEENLRNMSFQLDYPYISPRLAMFNIVHRCNAGCQYCADWKNDPDPKNDLPLTNILHIIDDLKSLGVQVLMLTGGEPFLRKDIFEIIEYARNLGFEVSLITNGTALTEKSVHRLAALDLYKIGVSIDSLDPERMFAIRRLPVKRVTRTIEMLADLRKSTYAKLNIALFVTVNRLNIIDLLPLAHYAQKLNVTVQYQPVHFSGSGTLEQVTDNLWPNNEEIDRLQEVVRDLITLKSEGYSINNRSEFLALIPTYFRDKTFYPGNQCTVAYTDIIIDTELGVRPCWSMEPVEFISKRTPLREIWFSEEMRIARKMIREKKCPGCLYACHINKSYTDLPPIEQSLGL